MFNGIDIRPRGRTMVDLLGLYPVSAWRGPGSVGAYATSMEPEYRAAAVAATAEIETYCNGLMKPEIQIALWVLTGRKPFGWFASGPRPAGFLKGMHKGMASAEWLRRDLALALYRRMFPDYVVNGATGPVAYCQKAVSYRPAASV